MSQTIIVGQNATAFSELISSVITVSSGGTLIAINEVIPPSSTNLQVALAFNYTKLKAYAIHASAVMTLEFNDSSTGVPTVNLTAGQGTVWHETDPHAMIFSANVTTLYVTSSAGGTLKMFFLIDPT